MEIGKVKLPSSLVITPKYLLLSATVAKGMGSEFLLSITTPLIELKFCDNPTKGKTQNMAEHKITFLTIGLTIVPFFLIRENKGMLLSYINQIFMCERN